MWSSVSSTCHMWLYQRQLSTEYFWYIVEISHTRFLCYCPKGRSTPLSFVELPQCTFNTEWCFACLCTVHCTPYVLVKLTLHTNKILFSHFSSILLGTKGFDVPRLSEKLDRLDTAKTFEPLEPVRETDIQVKLCIVCFRFIGRCFYWITVSGKTSICKVKYEVSCRVSFEMREKMQSWLL